MSSGKLYICSTPIGNLQDVSFHLLDVISKVDLILAEDTRRTRKLLAHFSIKTPLRSMESHREEKMLSWVKEELESGQNLAIVSDAGTPGISDPGGDLVSYLIEEGLEVEYVPGPSAVIASLVLSGLPSKAFLFHAYPPSKSNARKKLFSSFSKFKGSLVFFESPRRVLSSLSDMLQILGDRRVAVCREMTKLHQEILRGKISEVLDQLSKREEVKGEITIVLEGAKDLKKENLEI